MYNQTGQKAEADYTCEDLDCSGYHKNRIQLLFYHTLFYGKYPKTIVRNASRFLFCASKNTKTNAPSGCITRNHSSVKSCSLKYGDKKIPQQDTLHLQQLCTS